MSEKNDFIQLPPIKKDTPSDVVAFIWEYMKVPENSREKVKNLLKDAKAIRPLEDDEVDRSEVEAQQCVELTDTNRSKA